MTSSAPESAPETRVSVVVIGYAPAPLLAECLSTLRAQRAAAAGVEVVVVAHASHQGSDLRPLRAEFPDCRWVDVPASHNVARMRGSGISRSAGAVVALLEGDCRPEHGWIERLTALHPLAAVGGAVEPANYGRRIDWAAYFCEFAKFMLPLPARMPQLPGANVVYRRSALPDAALLERDGFYETFVNAALADADGHLTDNGLVVTNGRTWSVAAAIATRFHHGRGFAALRVRGEPARKRLPFLALAAALPPLLTWRVLSQALRRRRHVRMALAAAPWIFVLSVSWAFGEFMGYLAGAGSSLERWR